MSDKRILYVHGRGGSAAEAEQYENILGREVIGLDYNDYRPWITRETVLEKYRELRGTGADVDIIANSIGAWFTMLALGHEDVRRAYFVSPMVDMDKFITDRMGREGVSEEELREKGEIPTKFGQPLSWEYLTFVREHPITWNVPTAVLYGSEDHLVPNEDMRAFADSHAVKLTVMDGGEHWFHTPEQMAFLARWLKDSRI
ncbi:MAG: alpha/beta hydrolase [Synergistaceae bacterium]|nr:alpha/beta hydrolase [Synergistaceae bacterium]